MYISTYILQIEYLNNKKKFNIKEELLQRSQVEQLALTCFRNARLALTS